jgi:hypothetical protein
VPVYVAPPQEARGGWTPGGPRGSLAGRWFIGCGALLLLLAIGVGSCVSSLGRTAGAGAVVLATSGGEIDGFAPEYIDGKTRFVFSAAPGIGPRDGLRLGCGVVRPGLAKMNAADQAWILMDRAGEVIASSETPCP